MLCLKKEKFLNTSKIFDKIFIGKQHIFKITGDFWKTPLIVDKQMYYTNDEIYLKEYSYHLDLIITPDARD